MVVKWNVPHNLLCFLSQFTSLGANFLTFFFKGTHKLLYLGVIDIPKNIRKTFRRTYDECVAEHKYGGCEQRGNLNRVDYTTVRLYIRKAH